MVADFLALRRPSRHPYPFHLRISASSTASLGGQCQPAAGSRSIRLRQTIWLRMRQQAQTSSSVGSHGHLANPIRNLEVAASFERAPAD